MTGERGIIERLTAWATRLRADLEARRRTDPSAAEWDRTAIKDEGTSSSALPLTEVRHAGEDTPETIARALAGAMSDVIDAGDKPRTVRLYPLGADGDALRQGYSVKVDAETLRAVHVLAPMDVARMPDADRMALAKDAAHGAIIGRMNAHAELLHGHVGAALEHSHTMVATVTGALASTQSFARDAIEASNRRAVAAETREAQTQAAFDKLRADHAKLLDTAEALMDELAERDKRDERRSDLLDAMAPILQGMGVNVRRWASSRVGGAAPKGPPINGTPVNGDA